MENHQATQEQGCKNEYFSGTLISSSLDFMTVAWSDVLRVSGRCVFLKILVRNVGRISRFTRMNLRNRLIKSKRQGDFKDRQNFQMCVGWGAGAVFCLLPGNVIGLPVGVENPCVLLQSNLVRIFGSYRSENLHFK